MGYRVRPECKDWVLGRTTEYDGKYTIAIKIKDYSKKKRKYKNSRLMVILETLAHELAHTKYWEHNYKHFELTGLISVRFARILKKVKIKDISRRFNNYEHIFKL